jgi:hypothetical protein
VPENLLVLVILVNLICEWLPRVKASFFVSNEPADDGLKAEGETFGWEDLFAEVK